MCTTHVPMRFCHQVDHSFVCKAKEGCHVRMFHNHKILGLEVRIIWCLTPLSTIYSVILWQSVLLMEETGVSRENHHPAASH